MRVFVYLCGVSKHNTTTQTKHKTQNPKHKFPRLPSFLTLVTRPSNHVGKPWYLTTTRSPSTYCTMFGVASATNSVPVDLSLGSRSSWSTCTSSSPLALSLLTTSPIETTSESDCGCGCGCAESASTFAVALALALALAPILDLVLPLRGMPRRRRGPC